MRALEIAPAVAPLHVLCLGAHADDVEIGAGGTLLTLLARRPGSRVTWVVASAAGEREAEARASAAALLDGLAHLDLRFLGLRDGYLDRTPEAKEALAAVRDAVPSPDLVLTHHGDDRHQDHRALGALTWQLWRDGVVLEYEVPKWDGDLSRPNLYVPLSEEAVERKLSHLAAHFPSQRAKDWYDEGTFRGLMRLRGVECRAPSGHAEAFHARKLVFAG